MDEELIGLESDTDAPNPAANKAQHWGSNMGPVTAD